MKRTSVLLFLVLSVGGFGGLASADGGATVVQWETDYTGTNNWGNPCLGKSVVIYSTVHVEGSYVITPSGVVTNGHSSSTLIEGYDDHGWVMVRNNVHTLANGEIDAPEIPARAWIYRWQWMPVMEDPETGQRYRATFIVHGVRNANGEIVVDMISSPMTANNTCVPKGHWPEAWGPFPGA